MFMTRVKQIAYLQQENFRLRLKLHWTDRSLSEASSKISGLERELLDMKRQYTKLNKRYQKLKEKVDEKI